MKRILPVALMACAMTLSPMATLATERIEPNSIINSQYLHFRSDNIYSEVIDTDKWTILYTYGILSVTWKNLIDNCHPKGFLTWFEREGDNLIFNAQGKKQLCYCRCSFDVTSTFGQIEPGHYTITFRNYGLDMFTAEIDVKKVADISLSANKSGIRSISPANDMLSLSADGVMEFAIKKIG